MKNTRWVVLVRHFPHLLDITVTISGQRVIRNITVIKVTKLHASNDVFSTSGVIRVILSDNLLIDRLGKYLELIEAFFENWEVS